MRLFILIILSTITTFMSAQHKIPEDIRLKVKTALAYYPQLNSVSIEFRFKKNIKKSTMQARPTFGSFFRSWKNRSYVIFISEKFKISDNEFFTRDIPSDIFIGWIGHELGHIMDYQNRSKTNLIWFGIKYVLSDKYIIEAERVADTFAVAHGMDDYILKTKDFILNHAQITESYKNRIQKYYLSPEEIMHLVQKREVDKAID